MFQLATTRSTTQPPLARPGIRWLTVPFLSLFVVAAVAATAGAVNAQETLDEPTEAPDAQCRAATDMGTLEFPYELDEVLEPDDASTRVDFFRFKAEPGLALRADMTDQAIEPNTMHNPLLGLFNSNCDWLNQNDDLVEPGIVSLDARLDFTVPEDGVFILAAAASPDEQFNGSSDDTGAYTLRIDIAPIPPEVELPGLDPPLATIVRAPDGRIDVDISNPGGYSGYNIYRDGQYFTSVRLTINIALALDKAHFRFDGGAGEYCLVGFQEYGVTMLYSVCSDLMTVGPGGPSVGAPSAPRELRATIYSPGIAELFWLPAIDDGQVVAYRVRRDSVDIGTTDGRSYYESGLEPGRVYRYRISAIDNDGLEGPPARLDIQAATRGEVPPQQPTDSDVLPAPPGALSGVLYSPGVAEIFWERSADHASIAGYEVSRDGDRVAFHKGSSHFEEHLSVDVSHSWSVVAVSTDGVRSMPRRLSLADGQFTPFDESPSTAIIRRDTYAALVGHAFDVYVGDLYSSSLHALYGLEHRMSDAEVSRDTSGNPVLFEFACGDGRADLALLHSGTNYGEVYDWTFDNCRHDGLHYDGDLFLHHNARGPTFRSTGGVTVRRNADLATTFSGMAQWWWSQTAYFDNIGSWDTVGLALSSRTINGDLDITNSTSRFAYGFDNGGRFSASLSGGFDVRSDATGGTLMQVTTPVTFSYVRSSAKTLEPANTWNFISGQLEMIAEDGSRLLLDADTGNDTTVRVTIDNERGPDTFVTHWLQWQPRLRFDRYPLDAPDRVTSPTALPDAASGPAITPENYLALLDHAFDLYAGVGYSEPIAIAQHFVSRTDAVDTSLDRGIRTDRIDCDSGGLAIVRRIDDELSGEPVEYRINFDECDSQGYRLAGEIHGDGGTANGSGWTLTSDNLSWQDDEGADGLFRGRASQQIPDEADSTCVWHSESVNLFGLAGDPDAVLVTSDDRNYWFETENGVNFFTLNTPGARFEMRTDATEVLLEGGLSVASHEGGGHSLKVLTSGLTTLPAAGAASVADGSFAAGGLFMQAEDGSRLYLGEFVESSSAGIVIINSEGRHEIQTPWTSWQSSLPSARASACNQQTKD